MATTTLEAPKNINTILNDYSYKMIIHEYNNLYCKYNLQITNKQITNDYVEIDQLINNINNSSQLNSSQSNNIKIRERKCYPTSSNLVYATKELLELIMNPKFSSYLNTHASHNLDTPFDSRVLATGLKYIGIHYLDKKKINPTLYDELTEINNLYRSQKKDRIDIFVKKWTIKDRDIKINL